MRWFKNKYRLWKRKRRLKKLKEQDPFIYD